MSHKITAFVLTYNGEKYIEDCLKSLTWADEVMIVDRKSFVMSKTCCIVTKLL